MQRLRTVAAGKHLVAQALEFVGQMTAEIGDGLVVGAGRTGVGVDALPGRRQCCVGQRVR